MKTFFLLLAFFPVALFGQHRAQMVAPPVGAFGDTVGIEINSTKTTDFRFFEKDYWDAFQSRESFLDLLITTYGLSPASSEEDVVLAVAHFNKTSGFQQNFDIINSFECTQSFIAYWNFHSTQCGQHAMRCIAIAELLFNKLGKTMPTFLDRPFIGHVSFEMIKSNGDTLFIDADPGNSVLIVYNPDGSIASWNEIAQSGGQLILDSAYTVPIQAQVLRQIYYDFMIASVDTVLNTYFPSITLKDQDMLFRTSPEVLISFDNTVITDFHLDPIRALKDRYQSCFEAFMSPDTSAATFQLQMQCMQDMASFHGLSIPELMFIMDVANVIHPGSGQNNQHGGVPYIPNTFSTDSNHHMVLRVNENSYLDSTKIRIPLIIHSIKFHHGDSIVINDKHVIYGDQRYKAYWPTGTHLSVSPMDSALINGIYSLTVPEKTQVTIKMQLSKKMVPAMLDTFFVRKESGKLNISQGVISPWAGIPDSGSFTLARMDLGPTLDSLTAIFEAIGPNPDDIALSPTENTFMVLEEGASAKVQEILLINMAGQVVWRNTRLVDEQFTVPAANYILVHVFETGRIHSYQIAVNKRGQVIGRSK